MAEDFQDPLPESIQVTPAPALGRSREFKLAGAILLQRCIGKILKGMHHPPPKSLALESTLRLIICPTKRSAEQSVQTEDKSYAVASEQQSASEPTCSKAHLIFCLDCYEEVSPMFYKRFSTFRAIVDETEVEDLSIDTEECPERKCEACGRNLNFHEGCGQVTLSQQNNRNIAHSGWSGGTISKINLENPADFTSDVPKLQIPEGRPDLMGIPNTGLSCFINSALNCLYFVPQVYHYFATMKRGGIRGLTSALAAFVTQYGKRRISTDVIAEIRKHFPSFRNENMGSAYEFFMNVLQGMDKEASELFPRSSEGTEPFLRTMQSELRKAQGSVCKQLHDIFSVIIEETLICSNCGCSSSKFTYLRSLSLNLVRDKSTDSLSIDTCIDAYFAEQRDSEDATHFCKTCNVDRVHIHRKIIKSIGTALIIYLRRFQAVDSYAHVKVPQTLDISQFHEEAGKYSLYSMIQHTGSVSFGHYTCYAQTRNGWMSFNDSHARFEQPSKDYVNSSILFVYVQDKILEIW